MEDMTNNMNGVNNTSNGSNGVAVGGLVFGIMSLVLCWIPILPVILGIIGLILAIVWTKES